MTQKHERVQLSLSLECTPQTLSIHNPFPSTPLKLIATVKQTASPFPDRPVTLLTKYSCLDCDEADNAFFTRAMVSPTIATADPTCPTPVLPLRPVGIRYTIIRISGDPDIMKRDKADGFRFITVPAVDQGHAEVVFELPPERLMQRLGGKDEPVQDKLLRFLRPGDTYKIVSSDRYIRWWAFGSLDNGGSLKGKKIARWSLPDDMPLAREPGVDETEEVAHKLRDLVDLHNVNSLSSRSCVEDEQVPDIRTMRAEGWAFGEPEAGLQLVAEGKDGEATFTVVD